MKTDKGRCPLCLSEEDVQQFLLGGFYFFYCCTVHSEIHTVHLPTISLFITLGKV
jgi:hypothetical protein